MASIAATSAALSAQLRRGSSVSFFAAAAVCRASSSARVAAWACSVAIRRLWTASPASLSRRAGRRGENRSRALGRCAKRQAPLRTHPTQSGQLLRRGCRRRHLCDWRRRRRALWGVSEACPPLPSSPQPCPKQAWLPRQLPASRSATSLVPGGGSDAASGPDFDDVASVPPVLLCPRLRTGSPASHPDSRFTHDSRSRSRCCPDLPLDVGERTHLHRPPPPSCPAEARHAQPVRWQAHRCCTEDGRQPAGLS